MAETNIGDGDALHTFQDNMYGTACPDGRENITSLASKWQGFKNGYTIDHDNCVARPQATVEHINGLDHYFPNVDSRRVYITEYPDPTGDDMGNHCGWDPNQPPAGEGLKTLPGVTQPEAAWAQITVAPALREQTRSAAQTNQWTFISETGEGTDTIRTGAISLRSSATPA